MIVTKFESNLPTRMGKMLTIPACESIVVTEESIMTLLGPVLEYEKAKKNKVPWFDDDIWMLDLFKEKRMPAIPKAFKSTISHLTGKTTGKEIERAALKEKNSIYIQALKTIVEAILAGEVDEIGIRVHAFFKVTDNCYFRFTAIRESKRMLKLATVESDPDSKYSVGEGLFL